MEPRTGICLLRWTPLGQPKAHILQMIRTEQPFTERDVCILYTRKNHRQLSASGIIHCLFTPSESKAMETPWIVFHQGTETSLSNRNRSIWIPHLGKTDLIGNLSGNFCFTRRPPLVTVEHNLGCYLSLCPALQLHFAQIHAFLLLCYNLKLILVYTCDTHTM